MLPPCDVPIYNTLSTEAFLRDHVALKRPFILRGATESWAAQKSWQRDHLFEKHGKRNALVGQIPYAAVFGEAEGHVDIGDFIEYMDQVHMAGVDGEHYVFDYSDKLIGALFKKERNELPTWLDGWMTDVEHYYQFMLGPRGTGAPMHYHCDAVNFLVYGRKRCGKGKGKGEGNVHVDIFFLSIYVDIIINLST